MSKSLHTKMIVVAVAISFLGMAFSGLSGLAINGDSEQNLQKITETLDTKNVNMIDRTTVRDQVSEELTGGMETFSTQPSEQVRGIPFNDGFDTYTVGAAPPDPPWSTAIENDTDNFWGDESFEFDTVGNYPNELNWTSLSG